MAGPAVGTVIDGYRFVGGDPNNQASWVQNSERTKSQEGTDAAWIDALRSEARSARQVVPLANEFLSYNQNAGTGGLGTALGGGIDIGGFRAFPALDRRPERQAMEGLTSAMMRATMVPGQSKSMDSNKEMEFAIARLPNVNAKGDVNTSRVSNLQREAFMKAEQLKAAEAWMAQRGVPDGFEEHWASIEPVVAQQFQFQRPAPRTVGDVKPDPQVRAQRALANARQLPPAARQASNAFRRNSDAPFGSRDNPFVARDEATLNGLPKGSYAIAPDGSYGVID